MLYVIRNIETGELWENEDGWSDFYADVFTEEEKTIFDLPIGGRWEEK